MPHLPKARRRRYLPERKREPTGDQRFYNSTAWRKTSRSVRQRQPLCEVCTAIDQVAVADVTDHIIAREDGGADYDPRNLMAMCAYHHNRKSALEGQGLELDSKRTMSGRVPVDRDEVIKVLT
ncbi:HNH endonuclease signature motif containing protein [Lewinella sp. JB7]|uniref:HNH endonuclease signature motif containing protein n=1 Tax=Lewinella sp. JB7 TaxID=2962887 RepID=UPI0020CA1DCE|nr:HNH endonuclease signature motif containing protein [Lewinella sp. JB7]MCP9237145.1 HNH endonuclease [Lewinella sp. JB7]